MKILKNENIIVLQNEDFLIMKDKTKIQKIKCENGILVIDNLNLKKLKQIIKNEGNTDRKSVV